MKHSASTWLRILVAAALLVARPARGEPVGAGADAGERHPHSHQSAAGARVALPAPAALQLEYWLRRAAALSGQQNPTAARKAYERALQLDPHNHVAARELLWLLAAQAASAHDATARSELPAALLRFRHVAPHRPNLWRAYAAAYTVLGRPEAALHWFALGWRKQTPDSLWWADWAHALQRAGRPTAACRLLRHTVRRLSGPAQAAARPDQSAYEREIVHTYMLLQRNPICASARPPYPPALLLPERQGRLAAELRWLARRSGDADTGDSPSLLDGSDFQSGLLVRLRGPQGIAHAASAPGPGDTAERGAAEAAAVNLQNENANENKKDTEEEDDDEDEDAEEEEDATEDWDDESALAAAMDSSAEVEAEEPDATRPSFTAGLAVRSLGGLLLADTNARADLVYGRFGIGLRAGYTFLSPTTEWEDADLSSLQAGEADLAAILKWRLRKGRIEVGGGGNLRASQSLAYGFLHGDYQVTSGLQLDLNADINQITEDTAALRLLGARDRVTGAVDFDLTQREFLNAYAGWQRYLSRARERLADGSLIYVEAGHRLLLSNPGWSIRASAYWEHNRLAPHLPPGLQQLLADADLGVDDFAVPDFAMFGVGTTVRRGMPGVAPGLGGNHRLRLIADLWVGYLWPHKQLGFDLQLGLGLSTRRLGELSLSTFLANSRLPGGSDPLSWGIGLRYVH